MIGERWLRDDASWRHPSISSSPGPNPAAFRVLNVRPLLRPEAFLPGRVMHIKPTLIATRLDSIHKDFGLTTTRYRQAHQLLPLPGSILGFPVNPRH
jgi:hypothetical protein